MMVLAEFKIIARVQPPEITIVASTNKDDKMEEIYHEDPYLAIAIDRFEVQHIADRGEIVLERNGNILRTDKECYAAVYSQGINILAEVKNEN